MMKIFQLEISKLFYWEFLKKLEKNIQWNSTTQLVFTPNPEICLKTRKDEQFLNALQSADYLTSDGLGLYLAYQINDSKKSQIIRWLLLPYYFFNILFRKKYLYRKYGERICWSDLTSDLIKFAEENSIKIVIVDPYFPNDAGKCCSQENFRKKLSEKFPKLFFDFYILGRESQEDILEKIKNSDAKICFASLGMKKQEMFCQEVKNHCPNISLALGVGSSFDYYTGFQKRAPKIFRDLGFEWLYRIFTSPNKLKRLVRIKDALIVFPIKVLLYKK